MSEPDPIYNAIERRSASRQLNGCFSTMALNQQARFPDAEKRSFPKMDCEAALAMLTTVPSTMEGVGALLRYTSEVGDELLLEEYKGQRGYDLLVSTVLTAWERHW